MGCIVKKQGSCFSKLIVVLILSFFFFFFFFDFFVLWWNYCHSQEFVTSSSECCWLGGTFGLSRSGNGEKRVVKWV